MVAAMREGGFPAADLHVYSAPDHPAEGGLVAILPGRDGGRAAVLMIAHLDTVPADPARWRSPPFRLTEKDGYFYGRGVADDKGAAAILVDSFIRLRRTGKTPRRTLKIALTCGEETATAFNGAHYLATREPDLTATDLVLVPSGGSTVAGGFVRIDVAVAEKTQQNFTLTAAGPAGHASRPAADTAIYRLSRALARLADYSFPIRITPPARQTLAQAAAGAEPDTARAIRRLLADPSDGSAAAAVTADPARNALLRTTCVATIIKGGHQLNTVDSMATANINCRLLPGDSPRDLLSTLTATVSGTGLSIEPTPALAETTAPPPKPRTVLDLVAGAARSVWNRATIDPVMLTGATDARHFNAAGIAAYGVTALPFDADGNGVHGDNERLAFKALEQGRQFIDALLALFGGLR